jgi:hypothetical protein
MVVVLSQVLLVVVVLARQVLTQQVHLVVLVVLV